MATKVFISYAREDADMANRVYSDLKAHGVEPWLDTVDLLPGARWKTAVAGAVRECRYFLALMSSSSVNKRGYVQKELRHALDVLDELPQTEIFLIPVRLDECRPSHERLADLNWVDLFTSYDEGMERIIGLFATQEGVDRSSPEQRLSRRKQSGGSSGARLQGRLLEAYEEKISKLCTDLKHDPFPGQGTDHYDDSRARNARDALETMARDDSTLLYRIGLAGLESPWTIIIKWGIRKLGESGKKEAIDHLRRIVSEQKSADAYGLAKAANDALQELEKSVD